MVNLQKNSSLLADLWGEGATINVDGSTVNTLYVNDKYSNNDGNIQSAVINGVSENTRFGILGTSSQPTSAAYTKNDDGSYKLVITLTNGRTISYHTIYAADGYTPPAQATIVTDGTTGWLVEGTSDNACFLAGVLISTPDGSVAVEKIEVGQKILASVNGHLVEREVVWVGKSHKVANASKTEDEAGYPVRILKGALADNVPAQDMLITSEHCLVFAGNFIPVRMLVNNRTIFYDRTVTDYDYYHIETEKHSIIIADGVLTESYLDTGNRSTFVSDNNVVSIWSKTKAWATDAAAPLNVERSFVEPIFRSLAERANTLLNTHNASACEELITDHALHLVTASGATIMPIRRDENKVLSFILPAGVDEVRLVSRSGRPSEVIGPFVDDRRRLGVLVGAMTLISADNVLPVIDHLSTKQLNGWHTLETESVRWTNGNALLPLGDKTANKFTMLTIQIVAAGPYLLQVLENRKIRKSA